MNSSNYRASIIEDIFSDESSNPSPFHKSEPKHDYKNQSIEQIIRHKINRMYPECLMTKTSQHGDYGIYKALIETLTAGDSKYITAFVANDKVKVGSEKMLSSLQWTCFQTRTTNNVAKEFEGFEAYPQRYVVTVETNVTDPIHLVDEKRNYFVYKPENLPLNIQILKMNENDHFAERGTVTSALDLFQTVLTIET